MAGKTRSPNYPALGLPAALELTQRLWKREGRTAVPAEVAAKALGYGSLSGNAKVALGSLNQFGLVERSKKHVKLTDLALRLLHPESEEAKQEALREAAAQPELFRELAETHKQASDDAIRAYLITRKGFVDRGVRTFLKAFRDTLELVNPSASAYSQGMHVDPMVGPGVGGGAGSGVAAPSAIRVQPGARTFSWPLSDGVVVQVTFSGITGDTMRPEYFEDVRDYLELAKKKAERDSDSKA